MIGQDVLKILINKKYDVRWIKVNKKIKLSEYFDKHISETRSPWYKKLQLKLMRLCV